jgi:PAS domain S-box-containing protein
MATPSQVEDRLLLDHYRLLSQHARDIVLFIRPDGRIVEANPAAVAAYGYDREELLTRTIFDLRAPGTAGAIPAQLFQADTRGITFETVHRRKDGSTFPVEVSSLGADVGGERLLMSIIRDASERKRAEEALRESEARFRDLFENANDVIYTLDLEGRITSTNKRAEQTFGYTREEALGRSAADLVLPEYHARMYDALRRKLAGDESPTTYELEVLTKDGRRVPLEVASRLIVRDGRPAGIQGIARDVSERKRAEGAVRSAREQLRVVTETMSAAVTLCSRDLRCLWVSKRYAEWLGRPAEEIAGRPIREIIGPEGYEDIRPYVERVLRGEKVAYEAPVHYRGRGRRWIHAVYTPTPGDADVPDGWVAVITDITDRKRAEDALKEADRRKDEFLAMLAHELRNPLAPIRNSVQVLKLLGSSDPKQAQARDVIERQVAHMARLIDDLLDVSRITRGNILLRKGKLDLVALVRAAVEDHRRLLEETGLTLAVELPDRPLWMEGDPTRLAQVVGNLLHNANKFTDAGGAVRVRLTVEAGGETAVLSVRDSGIGLEPDILGRLFEPFSQADRSLDRSRGGLGLGLALVKGLVELHGGTVQASSPGPGGGAEFVLRLPLSAPLKETGRPTPAAASSRQALRVLVIEDRRDTAESLRMLLELLGHQVAVAYTGAPGLQTARSFHPDVVLCDIGLPGGMDGYAVARALRADGELFEVPLIAMSGYGQEEDQRRARQAGFDRHLTKPVDPQVLTQLLDALPRRPGR